MAKYIVKRVIAAVLTLLVLITVVFFLVRLMPGEPFTSEKLNPIVKENLIHYYGFDKPLIVQYFQYLGNLRCANLGFDPIYEGHMEEPPSMSWVSQFSNANMIKTDFFEARSTAYAKSGALVDDL